MYITRWREGFCLGRLTMSPVCSQPPGALFGQLGEGRDIAVSTTPSTKST